MSRSRTSSIALAVSIALLASSCGGSTTDDGVAEPVLRSDDDLSIDSDSLESAANTESEAAADQPDPDESAADAQDDAEASVTDTSTTLPQEEDTLEEEFFDAVDEFMSCLDAEGFEFIGTPNAALGADAPENAQPYIDALIACAARSGVQERLQEMEAQRAEMTPEEIEEENRGFLAFRTCMVGRGWVIPEPEPDENGLLFHGITATQSWVAPEGQTLATSDDTAECQAAAETSE